MIIQRKVMTKQKTDTNITQPKGFGGATWVDATRIHTRPPNTCRTDGQVIVVCKMDFVNVISTVVVVTLIFNGQIVSLPNE